MLNLNCKNVQHVKIYIPCNFEVNPITYFGVIALFSSNFQILILFVLYFKNYQRQMLNLNCKKYAACRDLPTLQFLSKSHYPFWSYCPFFIKILILFVLYLKNYKSQMLSLNCKHVQPVKIYLHCNFQLTCMSYCHHLASFVRL